MSQRTIYQADAIEWLEDNPILKGCSIITSMPDISEFQNMNLIDWKAWFVKAAELVLSRTDENGISMFYQTDIKVNGEWVDKSFLCQKAAEKIGHTLIFHKVICRATPGVTRFGRPAYSHLIGFSKNIKPAIAQSFPDVVPQAGEATWTRGIGEKACRLACKMILTYTETRTVVDPFCGHGSVLAIANDMGFDAIGVEISAKRARKARALTALDLHSENQDQET